MKPRLLDLFCGEGGAATGYAQAGFDVVGVDLAPQPNYPFAFIQCDALSFELAGFDVIHASPPCQAFTTMSNRHRGRGGRADSWPNLIDPIREHLVASGLPWILENVPGARAVMRDPVTLHGGMFGLRVNRPRLFETNWPLLAFRASRVYNPVGVYGKAPDGRRLFTRADGSNQYAAASLEEAREAMGMPWASWDGLREAVPPAYTEYLGRQLMSIVLERAA